MAEIGWVKMHRKIRDTQIWDDKEPFDRRSAWMDLVMMVNHEDKDIIFNGKPFTVKRGQRITSIRGLAERWHWSVNRTKRYLSLLEQLEMIHTDRNTHRTLLTLINYGVYQGEGFTDEHTNEHTDEHTDEYTDEYTDGLQTRNKRMNKKMNKNEKNEKKSIYGEYAHVKLTDQEREKLINDYGQQMADDSIQFLDEYIEMKGYKAKSHYLCIRKWVVDAVKQKKNKNNLDDAYEMMRKWAEEGT